jgi:hypothetical protein
MTKWRLKLSGARIHADGMQSAGKTMAKWRVKTRPTADDFAFKASPTRSS